jgi:serine phosphatase RsbU (regulator of sigma subunit)
VRADIETFAGGTEQSDDITMLVIEFNGSGQP